MGNDVLINISMQIHEIKAKCLMSIRSPIGRLKYVMFNNNK